MNGRRPPLDVEHVERTTDAVAKAASQAAGDATAVLETTASYRIPIEVQERIIDLLVPASSDAIAAALVCHSWYPTAIAVLYETITFSSRSKGLSVNDFASHAFKHPLVKAQLAKTHTVVFRPGAFSSVFPLVFGSMMSSLATLRIHDLKEPWHPRFFTAMSQFASVTNLELRGVSLYNLSALQRLIYALRQLEMLHISRLYIKQSTQDDAVQARTPPTSVRLRKLVLETTKDVAQHSHHTLFVDWLIRASISRSLSSLTLQGPSQRRMYPRPLGPDSTALVEKMIYFIMTVGSSLKELSTMHST